MSFADRASNKNAERRQKLGKLLDMLEEQDIDLSEIGRVTKANVYQVLYKDNDGQGHVETLAGIQFDPSWSEGPEWPVIQQSPPIKVSIRPRKAPQRRSERLTALVLPDIQAGYFQRRDGVLVPTHDEACLDIVQQVASMTSWDTLVMHGDNLDFPEMSTRYRLSPAFVRTTQATLDRYTRFGFEMRAINPEAKFWHLAGNHEERLATYILDNARAAFGLRRGRPTPSWPDEEDPVLSVPFLTRMDEWGCTFLPGYPASKLYLNDRLRIIHGHYVSPNATAQKYLDESKISTLFGHVHRREWLERTRDSDSGQQTVLAASFGCLCRIDGVVPSVKQGLDLDGIPVPNYENWQQGFGLVHYYPGDGTFSLEPIPIHDGVGYFRDQEIVARCDVNGDAL